MFSVAIITLSSIRITTNINMIARVSYFPPYLLFILYMNDFSRASNLLFSSLYADDTNIFIEGTEYHKVISTLNTELLKVSDWLNSNKLTINIKKPIKRCSIDPELKQTLSI